MRFALAGWLVVLALVLPGLASAGGAPDNGVSTMTPAQILAHVKTSIAAASSVHIYGSGVSGKSRIALNMRLLKGTGGFGHLAVDGLAFDVIRIGPTAYFKGAQPFWANFTKSSGLQQLFAGKWLSASSKKGQFASLTPLTNMITLTNALLDGHGKLTVGSPTKIDGVPVISLIDGSSGGVLYIATTGPAYPVRLKGGTDGAGQITFGSWNQPVKLTAPAKPLDFSSLTG